MLFHTRIGTISSEIGRPIIHLNINMTITMPLNILKFKIMNHTRSPTSHPLRRITTVSNNITGCHILCVSTAVSKISFT